MNKQKTTEKEKDRIVASGFGGALLGAAIAGPSGAIIGGIIGIILGNNINKKELDPEDKNDR